MTFFNSVNTETLYGSPEDISQGPRAGFLEGFKASLEQGNRAAAQFGIEETFREREARNVKALRDAGEENIPYLSRFAMGYFSNLSIGPVAGFSDYTNISRFYGEGGTEQESAELKAYDDRIDELRKRHPALNLRTSREMYDEVLDLSRRAEEKLNTMDTTFTGSVGEFVGGALSALNPRVNPLNFMTLPVGGAGKTVVTRVASQGVAQAGVEILNQVTGVQEQRRKLGLSHGFEDAAMRVAGAGLAGAAFQGLGEGVVAGFKHGKKWFFNRDGVDPAPEPPAPPAPPEMRLLEYKPEPVRQQKAPSPHFPLGTTRMARSRTILDMDYMQSRLDSWDGELPHMITPRGATAIPRTVENPISPRIKIDDTPGKALDELAREVDPQLFRVYDKLAQTKQTYRRWLQEMRPTGKAIDEKVSELTDKIEALDAKIDNRRTRAKERRAAEAQRTEIIAQREAEIERISTTDSPEMARVRKELIKLDEQMRDMAPLVSRAYAQAKGQWDLGAPDREAIRQMVRDGSMEMRQQPEPILRDTYENTASLFDRSMVERAPILEQAPKVEAKMRVDADAIDYAQAIIKENMKVLDEGIKQFRAGLEGAIENGSYKVTVDGRELELKMGEKIAIPDESGEGFRMISVKEFIEENIESDAELKAVQTCSIV